MFSMLKKQVTMGIELIGPEVAKEYLSKNTKNARKPSQANIDAYAADINGMNWEFTGEAVSFRQDGTLHNGQHRLLAIIKAGTAVPVLVVRGLPNETKIADWGKTRSISSWGKCEGLAVSSALQGMVRMIVSGINQKACPKGLQAKYIQENYEDLRMAEDMATTEKRDSYGRRAPMLLAVYVLRMFSIVNDDIIKDFFRIFNTGTVSANEFRDPSAPLTAVRQIMTQYNGKYAGGVSQAEQYNIVVQAILDYKNNRNRRRSYKNDDAKPIEYFEQLRMTKNLTDLV